MLAKPKYKIETGLRLADGQTGEPIRKHVPVWNDVKDSDVRSIWVCDQCQEVATVKPDNDSGTPFCTACDKVMSYNRTQIMS